MSKLIIFRNAKAQEAPRDKVMRIDCRGCGSTPDLGCIGCIRCICGTISKHGEPERILLRTGTEEEFSPETVTILREISDVFCRSSVGMDGRRCSQCVLSKESLEAEKWADFSLENIDEIIQGLSSVFVDCRSCDQCASDARRYFMMLRSKLEKISKEAAMEAFRIVGA